MTRLVRLSLFAAATFAATASPAIAGGEHHGGGHWSGGYRGGWGGGFYYPVMPYQGVYTVTAPTVVADQPVPPPQAYPQPYPYAPQGYPQMDPDWQRMVERCNQPVRHDDGTGGALIGGVVGGVIGNRVADGDRTLGTVAGAAIGAVAGAAIDKAEDKGAERTLREECDAFFAARQGPQGAYPGYGYGYPGYVMVPVMLPRSEPCVETTTVTEEWVDVPVRQRAAPRRPAPRVKRVKEKRVYTGS